MISDPMYLIPKNVQTRWASPENPTAEKGRACSGNDGRKRHPFISLHSGESATLMDLQDTAGTVRRIWITIDNRTPKMLRGLKIEAFWDGAAEPAVSAPLGDFFSLGLGRMATFQSALFASPEGRSFNCYIPMPFRTGARIAVHNETDSDLGSLYYDVDCTIGDDHSNAAAYFHAHWRREAPTALLQDYMILPEVQGRGRFLGCNLGVMADVGQYYHSWWGEGEVKIYLDGETANPTLCGTGTEDYIGTGWGQGQYAGLYQGCHVADHEKYHYCFYRLHVPDPVWFRTACRATIQQIGAWTPESMAQMYAAGLKLFHSNKPLDVAAMARARNYGLFERQDDVSSCAWFYLDRPTDGLPALPPVAERSGGLG
jgi:hypothetical protein